MIETPLNPDTFRERLRDLCARHHGLVRRTCRRYVQNRDDADDLAQEVLLKAARGWDAFKGDCAPATWLYRVAANHCADYLRSRRRQNRVMRLYTAGMEQPDLRPFPEAEHPSSSLTWVLEELRRSLGSPDRHIVYLRFDVGMKQDGIARITGIPRAGVARRLARIQNQALRLWDRLDQESRASLRMRRAG